MCCKMLTAQTGQVAQSQASEECTQLTLSGQISGAGVFPGLSDPFSCSCTKRPAQTPNLSALSPVQKVGKSCWERVTPQLRKGR